MPHSTHQQEALDAFKQNASTMQRCLRGKKGEHFWLESDDPKVFAEILTNLEHLAGVEIMQISFPDAQLACSCFGLTAHHGEERYALEELRLPVMIGREAEMVVDFIFTDDTLKDLATGLWLIDQGIEHAL